MTKPPPTHCEVCGEEPKHKQRYPLECVSGTWLCDRHAEYPKKMATYVCTEKCRGKLYDDKDEATSMEIAAGNRGRIESDNHKIVKLRLLNGATVSVVHKLFAEKWRKEA